MNRDYEAWNRHFEALCQHFALELQIQTVADPDAPRCSLEEAEGKYRMTANIAKVSLAEYPDHLGYRIGKILLPRLRLETERLVLRRYRPEDARDCFSFLSDERSAYMDCCCAFQAMDRQYAQFLETFGQQLRYMVVLRETGKVIGTVHLFPDDSRAVETMEIGYTIDAAYQRRGYALEAISALLELLQKQLRLELVTAGILPENAASEGLLRKLGFRREGLRRKAIWHEALDRPVDLIYYYRDR